MESRMLDFYIPHELRDAEPLVSEALDKEDRPRATQANSDCQITTAVAVVLLSINFFVIAAAIAEFSRSVNRLAVPQSEVQQTMGQWAAGRKLL
ncbi:MAG: hypothetical protein ACFB5Z_19715 [Elainellaceae cyanobacterium]